MNPFKGRHFQRDIILWAVRWYCKYGISYRELQEMLAERGVNVDHSTIYRWVQRYAPEMEKRLRWYWRNPSDLCPWHMDETYVKVNGRWAYLYRAVDSRGRTVDFYLSSRRNSKAAYRFLGKILNNVKKWQIPRFINTDKAPGTVAKLAMRQPFVLFKGLTFQKLCLPGAFRPGDHHNKMLRPGLCVVHASPQYL
ncbi:IS6 family transposase (plasmid) [Escherichia coli]|nr:IS6 family transposase [Escherichia coli]